MTKKSGGIFWHTNLAKRWAIYDSPARPSKSECRIIENFVARHKKPAKILILGATPEYRDLAHNQKAEVTCVDIGLEMILAMRELMKNKKRTDQEVWFRANWLDMPVANNYYNFVLGDLVIHNIPLTLQPKFFAKIKQVLRPGGYFITRSWWASTIKEPLELKVDKILKKGINKKSLNVFTWELINHVYDPKRRISTTLDMYRALKGVWRNERNKSKKKQIYKLLQQAVFHYPVGKTWWAKIKNAEEKMIKKCFTIQVIKHGNDHPCTEQCPIYFLKK